MMRVPRCCVLRRIHPPSLLRIVFPHHVTAACVRACAQVLSKLERAQEEYRSLAEKRNIVQRDKQNLIKVRRSGAARRASVGVGMGVNRAWVGVGLDVALRLRLALCRATRQRTNPTPRVVDGLRKGGGEEGRRAEAFGAHGHCSLLAPCRAVQRAACGPIRHHVASCSAAACLQSSLRACSQACVCVCACMRV